MASVKLGDLCTKIGSGATPRGGKEVYTESGVAFIRSQNVYNDRFEGDGIARISASAARSLDGVAVEPHDVLLNITGESVGRCCLAPLELGPARVSQHVMIVRPDPARLDNSYLRYWLISAPVQGLLAGMSAAGATRRALTKGMIEGLDTSFPPLAEQRRIAAILGALDDKIELNRKMNRTLEEMAQAIFKSWFIDFDGHDDLVQSELGPVPRGWEVGTLSDFVELNPESWNAKSHPRTVEYLDLSNASHGRIIGTANYDWADAPSRARRKLARWDVVVGCVRPANRSFALVDREGLTGSTGFAVLRPKSSDYRCFAYLAATTASSISRLAAIADGAAYPAVRPADVVQLPTVVPGEVRCATFEQAARPLFQRIQSSAKEMATLAELRDTLLPKLISGELRVPDAVSAFSENP